jgi:hypothetical protein
MPLVRVRTCGGSSLNNSNNAEDWLRPTDKLPIRVIGEEQSQVSPNPFDDESGISTPCIPPRPTPRRRQPGQRAGIAGPAPLHDVAGVQTLPGRVWAPSSSCRGVTIPRPRVTNCQGVGASTQLDGEGVELFSGSCCCLCQKTNERPIGISRP